MIEEINDVIESNYDTDWIALSDKNEIYSIPMELRFQKNNYGFKPRGLWLGKGNNWIEYIQANDMIDWISTYCSAFKIELDSNLIVLNDEKDYKNFTKKYSTSYNSNVNFEIDWKKVGKEYDGIIAYAPRRMRFTEGLQWTYGWDITSACIWSSLAIKDIEMVYEGCEDDNIDIFAKGGSVSTWKNKYNKKYGYPKNESHSLKEISKDTGVSMKGIQKIYNKGIGAYKTNPSSVRPNVKSKEQWAYARVYSSVMGGKASKVDAKELKMEKGGELSTYDFKGYEKFEDERTKTNQVFLLPSEYERVAKWLYQNHFPLWVYYNYLVRVTICKEDIITFKNQFIKNFYLDDISIGVEVENPSNKRFWNKSPLKEPRSYAQQFGGTDFSYLIVLVGGGEWSDLFKEKQSGLNIPCPKDGVSVNTVIHEFAHVLDYIRIKRANPSRREFVATHQRGFLDALRDILFACRNNSIPIVNILEEEAFALQSMLSDKEFEKEYKKLYDIRKETNPNTLKAKFNINVPKEIIEYDSDLDLKGSFIESQEMLTELQSKILNYKSNVLEPMISYDSKNAQRLYKATERISKELVRINSNLVFKEVKDSFND